MRDGAGPMENMAANLLSEIGFQHGGNQILMRDAGTVEAIVHLMSQIRSNDKTDRSVKLLWSVTCEGSNHPCKGSSKALIAKAVEAGVIPVLVRLLDSREPDVRMNVMDTLYKVIDEVDAHQAALDAEGGLLRLAGMLQDEGVTIEERSRAARILGEVGSESSERRQTMVRLGVIPALKELINEPTGRRRQAFAFALSRLDEEGDGIAAKQVARARERKEREANAKKESKEREKRMEERKRQRDALLQSVADTRSAAGGGGSSSSSSSRAKPTKPAKRARK